MQDKTVTMDIHTFKFLSVLADTQGLNMKGNEQGWRKRKLNRFSVFVSGESLEVNDERETYIHICFALVSSFILIPHFSPSSYFLYLSPIMLLFLTLFLHVNFLPSNFTSSSAPRVSPCLYLLDFPFLISSPTERRLSWHIGLVVGKKNSTIKCKWFLSWLVSWLTDL